MPQSVKVLAQSENADIDSVSNNIIENQLLKTRQQAYSKDIFEKYYNQCSETLKLEGLETPFTFDEFVAAYYDYEYDLEEFTNFAVEKAREYYELSKDDYALPEFILARACLSPNYLLSAADFVSTNANTFQRVPKYGDFDFSNVQVGDIIYEAKSTSGLTGHIAIIESLNHRSVYGPYIQTVEAHLGGVKYGFLDDTRMLEFGVIILRPNNATNNKDWMLLNFVKNKQGLYMHSYLKDVNCPI